MNRKTSLAIAACVGGLMTLSAQSAIDAYSLSQGDLRGTARFMSMAGAFGALGGDLSTLNQNPAGIGVYRSSEVGVTVDFDIQSVTTQNSFKDNHTHVHCNNFGYVGAAFTGSELMPVFTWGATYTRAASFDRDYRGRFNSMPTSLSNYVADYTTADGMEPADLLISDSQNPYQGINGVYPDWLSILSYNAYMINPQTPTSTRYNGLFQNGSTGSSEFTVRERGSVDEYNVNFGGNFVNKVYWGIGIGITDIRYSRQVFYDEEIQGARIPNEAANGTVTGNGYFALDNYKRITGNGFNFKAGVIVKPVDELRFGLAFHTPTYYSLTQTYDAIADYSYESGYDGSTDTDVAYFDYRMHSPWKMIASVAGVIGGRGILSFDYQRDSYGNMSLSDGNGYNYDYVNQNIKNYFKASNTYRLGAELRLTPQFSVRAGYSYQDSNVKADAENQQIEIGTSGTDPSYTFDSTTQYGAAGIGYRYKAFYADLAYVHRYRKSTFHPFTAWNDSPDIPTAKIAQHDNNIVVSIGMKF